MKSKMMEATIEKSSSMEMIARANGDEESNSTEIIEMPSFTAPNRTSMEADTNDHSTLTQKDNQDDKLKSTKYEMVEVREENERLKQLLGKLVKDYHSLQEKFSVIQQQEARISKEKSPTNTHQEQEDADMVSLSLGIKSSYDQSKNKDVVLGLDSKFEPESTYSIKKLVGCESTSQEQKEGPTEIWPPSKVLKTKRSDDDEVMQQSQFKKTRVCVRARCDHPVMNDGCQWRKYGQKIAKGNPCPRAYYRCTVSPNCPVRKQVQRFAEDMSILITTYEGTHNHALPITATAMAFTTSAAASMLQSRTSSSTSQPGLSGSTSLSAPMAMSTTYGSSHNIHESRSSPQFHFPNSSISTLNSHPTITLDLTAPTNSFNFNRFSTAQRYSPTCLDFSSSSLSSTSHPSGHFNHGMPSYSTNQHGLINLARQQTHVQESIYQPFVPKNNSSPHSQQYLTEKIAAATKVITTNPNFQSALAAALTSYVGDKGDRESKSAGVEGSHQQGSLNLFPPSLPFFMSKSSSSSPAENKDNS